MSETALSATRTLEPDIEMAPTSGRSTKPSGSKTPAATGRASEVVADRPGEVLVHLAQCAAADRDGAVRRRADRTSSARRRRSPRRRRCRRRSRCRRRPARAPGASLTPSPTIATLRPSACSSATLAALSAGSTSAITSSMPTSRRDALGVVPACPRTASPDERRRPSAPRSRRLRCRAARRRSRSPPRRRHRARPAPWCGPRLRARRPAARGRREVMPSRSSRRWLPTAPASRDRGDRAP